MGPAMRPQGFQELIRILGTHAKPYRVQIGLSLMLGVLLAFLEGVGLGLLVPILQGLTNNASVISGNPVIDWINRPFADVPTQARLQILMAVLLGVTVLKNGAAYGHTVLNEWLRVNLMRRLRCKIFDQLLHVGCEFLAERRSGDLWNELTTETNRTAQLAVTLVQQAAILFVTAVCVGLLFLISWPLTLLAGMTLGILSLLLRTFIKRSREAGKRISRAYADSSSVGLEALGAVRVIRLFGREKFERDRFDAMVMHANQADMYSAKIRALVTPISELFTMGMFALTIVLAAGHFVQPVDDFLPLLLTFLFILYRLMPRVTRFNSNRTIIANNTPALAAVANALSSADKPFVKTGTQPFVRLRKAIQFEHVSFSYNGRALPALNNVNLEIPYGKTTAIVGASGAGKSTLADLIPRLYDPGDGRIMVDEIDIRDLNLTDWRSTIGVVSQETFVFHASIRDNIRYGRLDATKVEIEDSSRRANAYEFISQMPKGFDTVVGDRGMRLSGGQRQRIAIARAILRNPQILILDEATSALDTASERLVQEALEDLSENRTVVIVAHRLSTISKADQVIVLQDGTVAEIGTHEELMGKKGVYWRYHSLQFDSSVTYSGKLQNAYQ